MPYTSLFAKQEQRPTSGAGYRSLFEESEEERKAREAQERLRAFQERYPGATPGINPKLLPGASPAVERQDPAQEVDAALSGFVTTPSGEGGVKEGLGRIAESVAGLADLPALVGSVLAAPPPEAYLGAQIAGDPITPEREQRMRAAGAEAGQALVPGFIERPRGAIRANYQRIREREVEEGVEAGKSPGRIATEDTVKDAVAMIFDPLNWVGGGGALKGGRAIAREGAEGAGRVVAREAAKEVAETAPRVASHAGQAGESPEAIARVARGERYYRVSPGGEVTPIPNTVDAVDMRVNPGEAKVRVTSQGTVEIDQGGRGGPAQGAAIDRLRREGPAPEPREPPQPEPRTYELDAGEGLPSEAPRGVEVLPPEPEATPPWQMKPDELRLEIDRLESDFKGVEVAVFGEEGARRYARLQRKANSSVDLRGADEAYRQVEQMESMLTDAERRRLFGMDEAYAPEDLRDYVQAAENVYSWSANSPQELGDSLRWTASRLSRETDPAKMSHRERVAWYEAKTAFDVAREKGWDTSEVSAAMIQSAAGRFSDPEDVEVMLSRFRSSPAPAPASRRIGAGTPGKPSEAGFIRVGPDPKPKTPQDEVLEEFDSTYFDRSDRRETLGDRLVGIGRRIRDEMEDELQPVVRAVREGGDPVQVREMEEMLQQVRAAPTRSEVPVVRHTTAFDPATGDEVVTGGSLLDVLRGHDEELLLDAERYMAAQRNLELADRAARGAQVKVSDESVAASRAALQAVRQKYGQRISEIDEVATGYRDWAQRAQIDPLVRVGVYTPEDAQRIIDENTLYAIYDRVDRDLRALGIDLSDEAAPLLPGGKPRARGGGGPRAGSPVKRIHGGLDEEGKIQGIFESSALQAMRVQKFVDRQQVRNMLGRLGDEVDEIPIQRLPRRQVPVARVLDEATGEAETIFRAQERGGATFVRYEDGQRIEYAAPPDVLDALGRLTPAQASTALAPARFATQALRVGAVENPSFAAFNAIRDAFLAPIFSRHGMIPGYDVAKTAGSEALRRLWKQGPSEAWQVAEEFGGFATMMDVDRVSMRRAITRAKTLTESGGGGRKFLSEWARNPLLPFHVVGASLERLNRATEAALALRGGRRKIPVLGLPIPGTLGKAGKKAATRRSVGLDAADITLNFMRGGRVGKVWNRYEAFSNAMLQDVSKFSREMKADPFGVTSRAMAYVGVPSIVNYLMNRDDPDYQELPEWEKALFYHPKKLDNGWWMRVPRPLGLVSTFFGYGSHKAVEAYAEENPEAAGELLEELVRTTPAEFIARPGNLQINAFQPMDEAQSNYSEFLDRPIVPQYQMDWPAEEQYGENTSQTMVDIGEALKVSPRLAQYVFESHTGTLGRESLALLDRLRSEPGDAQDQDAKDIPILGRFVTRPAEGFNSQSVQEFYDLTDEAMGARSAVRSGASVNDHPVARMGLKAGRARRRMGELSDRLSKLQSAKNLSEDVRRERMRKIRQEMTAFAQRYIDQHKGAFP